MDNNINFSVSYKQEEETHWWTLEAKEPLMRIGSQDISDPKDPILKTRLIVSFQDTLQREVDRLQQGLKPLYPQLSNYLKDIPIGVKFTINF